MQIKQVLWVLSQKFRSDQRGEFGMSAIISIAVGLIITTFIVIPGIRTFAGAIMTDMQSWWDTSISATIFPK